MLTCDACRGSQAAAGGGPADDGAAAGGAAGLRQRPGHLCAVRRHDRPRAVPPVRCVALTWPRDMIIPLDVAAQATEARHELLRLVMPI